LGSRIVELVDADPFLNEYDTLLPGESTSMRSDDPRDIDHWIRVYSELVGFKEKILDMIGSQRENVEAQGRLEVQHDDMIFRREYMRLQRRLDFWRNEKEKRSA
jgi:hypothetical protein